MPPKRTTRFQDRASKRRRTNNTAPHPTGLQANQQPPPARSSATPGQSCMAQLSPDLISAITAAVMQVLQTAYSSSPPIQFVPDPEEHPPPCNGNSADEHPSTSTTSMVQETVDKDIHNVIDPQDTQGSQSKNTFLSAAIPLSHRVDGKSFSFQLPIKFLYVRSNRFASRWHIV